MASQYTMHYGSFIGLDASSDPREVERNRLAYCVNMWRDYESEQGAAIETFPGFRRVAQSLGLDGEEGAVGAIHGLYHFRTRRGADYVVIHAGVRLYALEIEALAAGEHLAPSDRVAIIKEGVADADSVGFIINNNLYILDGSHYLRVSDVGEESVSIAASAVDAYVPTTYYNGNLFEQRNMLSDRVVQVESRAPFEGTALQYSDVYDVVDSAITGATLNRGFADDYFGPLVYAKDYAGIFSDDPRKDLIRKAYVDLTKETNQGYDISNDAFKGCTALKSVYIRNKRHTDMSYVRVKIGPRAFADCPNLTDVYISEANGAFDVYEDAFPEGVTFHYLWTEFPEDFGFPEQTVYYKVIEPARRVLKVKVDGVETIHYTVKYKELEYSDETVEAVDRIYFSAEEIEGKRIEIELEVYPTYFNTVENVSSFLDGNLDYKKTGAEAIGGCTKAAVYDGRVFLTGNGELPNTVFYSNRNLTGANDPAYFGIYNYFNDGVGNTPNVDLLATPSYLMVIKGDTVQDGSVYYHVGMDNTEEFSADLLPRIYPSTQGAAGLGSAGKPSPSRLSCNFLDDPVFLSKRGLEGVSKQTVNLERTVGHRSSNVDRLLIKENLAHASLAEWKGYLVICCEGHIYLADSRYLIPHADGSYQYEWYYLEGVGTYDSYAPRWGYWVDAYPLIEREGAESETLDRFVTKEGKTVGELYKLHAAGDVEDRYSIMTVPVYHPEDSTVIVQLYYVTEDGVSYVVGVKDEELVGLGSFHGASKVLVVGDRLLFGTDGGDVCVVNTDMRGVAVGDRVPDPDRIDRSFYSFGGVAYRSGCSFRLDDCGKKSVTKYTECGTTAVRFKMMPGRAKINVSLDGRNWHRLGEAFNSRFDFADLQFSNFSFGENENNVVILPELTRGWTQKQYFVYNDRFEEPFGLYELSYVYYVYGKIRY